MNLEAFTPPAKQIHSANLPQKGPYAVQIESEWGLVELSCEASASFRSVPEFGDLQDLVPGYRKAIEAYVEAVSQLGFHLVQLLALALHLPKGYFDTFFQQPMTYLRPLHYSNEKSSEEARIFGAGWCLLSAS